MKSLNYALHVSLLLFLLPQITYSQTLSTIDSLKMELLQNEDLIFRADIYIKIAEQYRTNDPDKAIENATEAYHLSKDNNYPFGLAKSLNLLGDISRQKAEYKKALKFATQADSIARRHSFSEEIVLALKIKGYVFNYLGDFDKCMNYFFDALKLSEEIDNKKLISTMNSSIGYANYSQANYEEALNYYLISLSLSRELDDPDGIARELNNLAATYAGKGEWKNFKMYVWKAMAINKKSGNRYWLMINYMNMGAVHDFNGDSDSAIYYTEMSFNLAEELENTARIAMINTNFGNLYFTKTSQTSPSYKYAYEALSIAKSNYIKKEIFNAASLLIKLYTHDAVPDSALKYTNLMWQIKDSLDIKKNEATITRMQLQYELDKVSTFQENERKQFRLMYVVIIGALFTALLIVLFFLYRFRIRSKIVALEKQKLNDELQFKNMEMTANVMSLMKRNETVNGIVNRMIELEKHAVKDETKEMLLKLAVELNNATEDKLWDEFEAHFSQIHVGFYRGLKNKYPELTQNDLRLCALLRLNLSTKEIAQLTGQSLNALETARYRLRKRLNLSNPQQNLVTFLIEF